MGRTTPLCIILAPVPLVFRLFDILFKGACSPLNSITDMSTMPYILSSVARDPMLMYFLLLVHLVGSVPQHFLIASSLTNSTHHRMDRQIVPSKPLR